ncbi:MAG: type 4a pilus biogenesis protein PilO [Mariprofundaceae bacterium]|nr:type 4a pilus biogenesis protein PilO [Mariprofundaceae bacterium]
MKIDLSQLNALRPMLALPVWQCVAGLAGVVVLLLGGYVFNFWMPLQDNIKNAENDIKSQETIMQRNLRTARDLPRKKRQFEVLKRNLKLAQTMLPEKSQIPDLLDGVSIAGRDAGLEFSVFKPLREIKRELHAEVPVSLTMKGTFRQLALFLRTVGEMPRIVNVMDLSFVRDKGQMLTVTGRAVTYRLLDESELKKNNKKAKAGKGR